MVHVIQCGTEMCGISHELILWLKVHQKAGICIQNFKNFPGVTTHTELSLWEVAIPSRFQTQYSCFGMCIGGKRPLPPSPVQGHKL